MTYRGVQTQKRVHPLFFLYILLRAEPLDKTDCTDMYRMFLFNNIRLFMPSHYNYFLLLITFAGFPTATE